MVSPYYTLHESDNATITKSANEIFSPIYGNKCSHNRFLAREFTPPTHHLKKRPPIIEKAKRLLNGLFLDPISAYVRSEVFYYPNIETKRKRFRKKRSEIREAICLVGSAILHTLNLKAMVLGFIDKKTGKFVYFSLKYLSQIANISYKRVKKAFKALKDGGYATITERFKKLSDGKMRAINPIISIKPQLFYDLGIDDQDIRKAIYNEYSEQRKNELDVIIEKTKQSRLQARKAKKEKIKNKIKKKPIKTETYQPEKSKPATPQVVSHYLEKIRQICGLKKKPPP